MDQINGSQSMDHANTSHPRDELGVVYCLFANCALQ